MARCQNPCSSGLQLHSVDRKAEETACASGRACAASYPVQVTSDFPVRVQLQACHNWHSERRKHCDTAFNVLLISSEYMRLILVFGVCRYNRT